MQPQDQIAKAQRAKKITELARSIRKKYAALKLGRIEEDESLEKVFRPVTQSLRKIIKPEPVAAIQIKPKKEEKYSSSEDLQDDFDPNESLNETQILDVYPEIAQKYLQEFNEKSPKIDNIYGPIYDASQSKWLLGKKNLDFDKNTGDIIIEGKQFPGTEGLYELIFYNNPLSTIKDKKEYEQILKLTGAHLNALGKLKGSPRLKYVNIIRPLIKGIQMSAIPKPKTRSTSGTGMHLTYNEKPIEYVYWDDINELVDRLRLLVASKDAGNTSHDNEIVAIINELKEANVIC